MPEEDGAHLPAAVENAAYYVVAEALSNAVKHADATKVDITVERVEEDLVISVAATAAAGRNCARTASWRWSGLVTRLSGRQEVSAAR